MAFSFQLEYQAALYYPEFYRWHLSGRVCVIICICDQGALASGSRGADQYGAGGKKRHGTLCRHSEQGVKGLRNRIRTNVLIRQERYCERSEQEPFTRTDKQIRICAIIFDRINSKA